MDDVTRIPEYYCYYYFFSNRFTTSHRRIMVEHNAHTTKTFHYFYDFFSRPDFRPNMLYSNYARVLYSIYALWYICNITRSGQVKETGTGRINYELLFLFRFISRFPVSLLVSLEKRATVSNSVRIIYTCNIVVIERSRWPGAGR